MTRKNLRLGCVDVAAAIISYILVFMVALMADAAVLRAARIWIPLVALLAAYALIVLLFRVNETIWKYAGEKDYIRIGVAMIAVCGIFALASARGGAVEMNFGFHLLAVVLGAMAVVMSRVVYRVRCARRKQDAPQVLKKLLIVGAGHAGSAMIADIHRNPSCGIEVVGLVDDDKQKMGGLIAGVQVLGTTEDIAALCKEHAVEMIYLAMPSATNAERARILKECEKTGCSVKTLPYLFELDTTSSNNFIHQVRDITPEELLGRDPIQVADEHIYEFLNGKRVLITGGGGSIGSELCRQIAAHSPSRLVIVDIYENNAYNIQQELRREYGDKLDLEVYIASVRDARKIDYLFSIEKPQIVFHAAAHKHVPLMEVSPDEAIKNNVFGTYNTAMAARNHGVDRFVLISTDKAVNPTNIMGASKRVCEMVVQYFAQTTEHTTYAAVRFGNVLGSNGSVIPLFKEQIVKRSDITVTDPRIIRYFMTIPEASQLVLTAGAMAHGGEIFVLDMGEPVKIDDLARKMIRLAGLTVGKDINIRYIGLRPGEKLYEELLMSEEGLKKTLNHKIFISSVLPIAPQIMEGHLQDLRALVIDRVGVSGEEVEQALVHIVPSFKRYVPPCIKVEQTQDDTAEEKKS